MLGENGRRSKDAARSSWPYCSEQEATRNKGRASLLGFIFCVKFWHACNGCHACFPRLETASSSGCQLQSQAFVLIETKSQDPLVLVFVSVSSYSLPTPELGAKLFDQEDIRLQGPLATRNPQMFRCFNVEHTNQSNLTNLKKEVNGFEIFDALYS